MFAFNLLVFTGALSVQPTRKVCAARAMIGIAGLIELIIKIGTIAETAHFFVKMGHHVLSSIFE